jgi:hypothetical protein
MLYLLSKQKKITVAGIAGKAVFWRWQPSAIQHPDERGSTQLWNVGRVVQDYTGGCHLHTRRRENMESHIHSTIFCTLYPSSRSRGGSLGIVFDYGLDDQAIEVRSPEEAKRIFPPASVSRPALEPTQLPVQWVPEVLSPRVKRGRGVRLTTYPHLVSRSWVSMSYASSPPAPPKMCCGTVFPISVIETVTEAGTADLVEGRISET